MLFSFCVLLFTLIKSSNDLGETCSENLDCGSCVHYNYCNTSLTTSICVPCITDSNCNVNKPDICDIKSGFCKLSPIFKTFNTRSILTSIIILIGALIAAGGGLGGGGVFVPIFILILGLDSKSAAALSQATIFGGSIVNIIMNIKEKHPIRQHRPLTDFNTMLILVPLLLAGTVIGVLLNEILPDPIIAVILMLVLIISVYKMFVKGFSQWKKENNERSKLNEKLLNPNLDNNDNDNEENNKSVNYTTSDDVFRDLRKSQDEVYYTKLVETNINTNGIEKIKSSIAEDKPLSTWIETLAHNCGIDPFKLQNNLTETEMLELEKLIIDESQIKKPLFYILIVWIIVSVFACLRQGIFFDVKTCSLQFWSFEIAVFPCMLIITWFISKQQVNKYQRKLQLGWIKCEGDIEWTTFTAILYSSISLISGLCGGLLGIGGGMIIGPLLLELGVLPRVASATSALAVLLASSSSVLQKSLLNMLQYDYMLFYMFIGIIATYLGQTMINIAIKKFGRNSLVVFSVASIIFIAIFLMGANTITSASWNFNFNSPCN